LIDGAAARERHQALSVYGRILPLLRLPAIRSPHSVTLVTLFAIVSLD
jgi:hypothetical protein